MMDNIIINKKAVVFIGLVSFLVIMGSGLMYFWHSPLIQLNIIDNNINEKCVNDFVKNDFFSLIDLVSEKDISQIDTSNDIYDQHNERFVNKRGVDYLICDVFSNNQIDRINELEQLVKKANLEETVRANRLLLFNDYLENSLLETFLINFVALADLGDVCPDILPSKCIDSIKTNYQLSNEDEKRCMSLCETLKNYSEDENKFISEIINFKDYSSDINLLRRQYQYRIAVAFQISNYQMSLKICENVPIEEKANCIGKAEVVKARQDNQKGCHRKLELFALSYCLRNQ